jgi:hypothetical protein
LDTAGSTPDPNKILHQSVPERLGPKRLKAWKSQCCRKAVGTDGKTFTIPGKLEYQACDEKICYLPASVPVEWQLIAASLIPCFSNRAFALCSWTSCPLQYGHQSAEIFR